MDNDATNYISTQIKIVKKYLKWKLTEDNKNFRDYKNERQHVYDLIRKAISQGESHSALVIGPRGCGKTTLINSVLDQIATEVDVANDAIIIKLNGLLHHDEKKALNSITAQMKLENAVGDRVFGTFAENFNFLLNSLVSTQTCVSMIFILDNFEMFCHTTKPQTLLYNLFDITHNQLAPMCVLGITLRLDVIEIIEKRVKSRFSRRNIFILSNEENQQQISPIDNFKQVFVQNLSLPVEKKEKRRKRKSMVIEEIQVDVSNYLSRYNLNSKIKLDNSFAEEWNAHITSFVDEQVFLNALEKFCYFNGNEQVFKNVLFKLVMKLSPTKPYIDPHVFSSVIDNTVFPDQRVKSLQSLSILELSLVIAMMHGMDIFDGQPMNFEMVLHRYTQFANTNSSVQSVCRPVVLKAFEHLQELEIIMPIKSTDSIYTADTTNRVQKEYKLYTLPVPVNVIKEAVKGFKALPTEINQWINNSVL